MRGDAEADDSGIVGRVIAEDIWKESSGETSAGLLFLIGWTTDDGYPASGDFVCGLSSYLSVSTFNVSPKEALEAIIRTFPNVLGHTVIDEGIESLCDQPLAVDDGSDTAHLVR